MMKCKCGKIIPKERTKLGYNVCVNCSTEQKYGFIHVFEGKTANTIQVIKDPNVAIELQWRQTRQTFGVANGMYRRYGGKKRGKN